MEVLSTVVQLASGVTLATLGLAVFLYYVRPGYLMYLLLRYGTWRSGCTAKYVKVGAIQFAYMERGEPSENQPSLLLVHGFADIKESFCEMIAHLPQHVHLIAVDLPGHGNTTSKEKDEFSVENYAAKIHQFVSAVGLDRGRLHVLGHSMGGGLVGCYAALYPDEVSVLTMMCPGGVKAAEKSVMFERVAQGDRDMLIPETAEQAEDMFDLCLYDKSLIPPKQLLQGFVDYYVKPKIDFQREMFNAIIEKDDELTPYLGKISAPTQVIWGRHDQLLHITCLDVMKKEIKVPLQVDIIENSGHTVPLEAPTKAATLLLNFREKVLKKAPLT